MYRLENEFVVMEATDKAAEITSFSSKKRPGEWIWSGDPTYWANRNPILFPITGGFPEYQCNGRTCKMGNHGIARYATFQLVEANDQHIVMHLTDNEELMNQYPFKFDLQVEYHLEGYKLVCDYTVTNNDTVDLPFTIGFHPGFNVPVNGEGCWDDYYVQFNQVENPVDIHGNEPVEPTDKIEFTGNTFFTPKLSSFYSNLQSEYCTLTNGDRKLRVYIKGYDCVGFWHKSAETPFMCIEPWYSKDFDRNTTDIYERTKYHIAPGTKFETRLVMEIVED